MIHPHESKAIGWEGEMIQEFPTANDIEQATRLQLAKWWRYLRGPKDDGEALLIRRIGELLKTKE